MHHKMSCIKDCERKASVAKDDGEKRQYLEMKKKATEELVGSLNKMDFVSIIEPVDFSDLKKVVKFERENNLHKVEGVTVYATSYLKEHELADVKSGCEELNLELLEESPLPPFDHWTSLK